MYRALVLILLLSAPVHAADWKLVWAEEFDYPGLPDSTRWVYEEGFVRNEELQYYTHARLENARVEDGMLVLEARREKFSNPGFDPAEKSRWSSMRREADYTSASITTQGRRSWCYGRIEVRAKLPSGRGMWPAIWMLGTNIDRVGWPACGEIDIMEFVGFDPNTIHGTVHTEAFNHVKKTQRGSKLELLSSPHEDFHVYAIEWDTEKIDFFVDSTRYFTFRKESSGNAAWPFDKPHYLILNVAVGGAWGGVQGVDESIFPRRMVVDYVRVFQAP